MFEKYPQQILSDWDVLGSEQLPVFPEKKKNVFLLQNPFQKAASSVKCVDGWTILKIPFWTSQLMLFQLIFKIGVFLAIATVLTVSLTQSRGTCQGLLYAGSSGLGWSMRDSLGYIGWDERSCPLWVPSLPRQWILNRVRMERAFWAVVMCALIHCWLLSTVKGTWLAASSSCCPDFPAVMDCNLQLSQINASPSKLLLLGNLIIATRK